MYPRTPLLIVLAVCLGPLSAFSLEFRVISWQGDIAGLKYADRGEVVGVEAHEQGLSTKYLKTEPTPLAFFREVEQAGRPPLRETVAVIPLPGAGVTRAVLVLAPGGDTGDYAGRWIDDTPEAHPANTVRIYNFTSRALALQASGEQWGQAPGEIHRVAFDQAARQLPMRIAARVDDGWALVITTPQPVRRNYRVHLLLRDARSADQRPNDYVESLLLYDYVAPRK